MPTATRTRTSRPANHKDAAAASAVIDANRRTKAKAALDAQAAEPSKSDAALKSAVPAPMSARKTTRGRVLPPSKTGDPATDRKVGVKNAAGTDTISPAHAAKYERKAHQFVLCSDGFKVHKMGCRDIPKALRESQYEAALSGEWASEEEAVRDLYADQIAESEPGTGAPIEELGWYTGATQFMPCCDLIPLPISAEAAPEAGPLNADHQDPGSLALSEDGEVLESGPIVNLATGKVRRGGTTARKAPARQVSQATQPTGAAAESPAQAAKRAAKRALARKVLLAIEKMVNDEANADEAGLGFTRDEAAKIVSQWVHHLPVRDSSEATPWWPETLPLPDRSDWK